MRVTFDPAARDDLDRAFAWIAQDNPRAALELIARIRAKVLRLESPQLIYIWGARASYQEPASF